MSYNEKTWNNSWFKLIREYYLDHLKLAVLSSFCIYICIVLYLYKGLIAASQIFSCSMLISYDMIISIHTYYYPIHC